MEESGTETTTAGGRGPETPSDEDTGTAESAVEDTGRGKLAAEALAAATASEAKEGLTCLALWRRKYDGSAKVREQISHL